MAIATLKFVCKPNLHLCPTPFQCVRKVVPRSVPTVESEESSGLIREQENKKGQHGRNWIPKSLDFKIP
ncbi:hypothetical protein SESBI_25527 [Sesbania bispinosa]|nr:hypothetical protein SESBI_25527 [Sesbania bispinosa]